ncbi:MAG: type II toxin-antitoxin system RelE/ParE family toxin [Acidobacteriia bacterium]|nr:type II toxin-antitoxin system RelE/ParE family toxin [Terriglobia bacterium]
MPESKPYRLHPEVWLEIEAADDWYLERSADASAAFIAALSDAFENISQAPERWPKYSYGTRRFVLHRFPFSIIYLDDPDVVSIVAVAHSKRKPRYWKARL